MAQDIKKLLKAAKETMVHTMPEGHDKRFMKKLNDAFPKNRKRSFGIIKIAASIAIILSVSYLSYIIVLPTATTAVDSEAQQQTVQTITLGDVSPDLKKIEDYYITHINLELLALDITEENKQLFRNYMTRLTELNDEYQRLNKELNAIGPNEQTINALIDNLQIRLQLLYKLKEKLSELKTVNHENRIDQKA